MGILAIVYFKTFVTVNIKQISGNKIIMPTVAYLIHSNFAAITYGLSQRS